MEHRGQHAYEDRLPLGLSSSLEDATLIGESNGSTMNWISWTFLGVGLQNFIYASIKSVPRTKIPSDSARAKLDAAPNTPAGLTLSSSLL